jgi:hypothetical protein
MVANRTVGNSNDVPARRYAGTRWGASSAGDDPRWAQARQVQVPIFACHARRRHDGRVDTAHPNRMSLVGCGRREIPVADTHSLAHRLARGRELHFRVGEVDAWLTRMEADHAERHPRLAG